MKISSFTKPSNSFSGNVLKLMSGTVLAQALGVLAMPIVTRLFAPEAFGVAAVFSSMTGIVGVVACLRYEIAIMLPESSEEAANILGVSLLSVILMTFLTILIVWLGGEQIIRLLHAPQLKHYLWLVPIAIFFQGIFLALNYWNTRTKHFGRLSVAKVISSVTADATKLAAGFLGFVSAGILIGTLMLKNILSMVILGGQIWREDKNLFVKNIRWKAIGKGFIRYKKFLIFETWAGLLNSISSQLPALMLSSFFSIPIVGFYSLGLMIVQMPLILISGALSQVFYQKASQNKNTQEGNKVLVEKLLDLLIFYAILPVMIFAITGEELFSVLFGETWREAGRYTQILSPYIFFTFISSPLSSLFAVYERQGTALFLQSLIFITRLLSLYIGGVYQNIHLALGLFSITGVFVYGAYALLNIRFANASVRNVSLTFMKYFIYYLPAGICLFFIKYVLQLDHIILLTAALSLCAFYFFVFRRKYFSLLPKKGFFR